MQKACFLITGLICNGRQGAYLMASLVSTVDVSVCTREFAGLITRSRTFFDKLSVTGERMSTE